MKRTFNLKVSARELGALVTYFDVSGKKVANCSAFLNAFVQVRVQCEEFKVVCCTVSFSCADFIQIIGQG
jgi:hypothetical protein